MNHFFFTIIHDLANRSPLLDAVIVFVARAGIWIAMAAAIIFFAVLFSTHKNWKGKGLKIFLREIGVIVITVLSALIAALVLKAIVHEARPFIANPAIKPLFTYGGHDSFPSGHAALLYAFAMAVALYHERTGWIFFLFALLVSWCRVIAGIHYPADIMGGVVLGLGIAYCVHRVFSRMRK